MGHEQWFKTYVSVLMIIHMAFVLLIKNSTDPTDESQQITLDVAIVFLIAYVPLYIKGLTQ